MDIIFPGGFAVDARFDGFSVRTDQPVSQGGANSAPSPFDLFLASIGTCIGFYVLRFCRERNLPTESLRLNLETERDVENRRLTHVKLAIHLPPGFPGKYQEAIIRTANQCSVKKTILDPPEFEVVVQ